MNLPLSVPFTSALLLAAGVGLAALLLGGLFGFRLGEGTRAIEQNAELVRITNRYAVAAAQMRERGMAIAQDFRATQESFAILAGELNRDLGSLDAVFAARLSDLQSLVAAHPEWAACDIGADGLRLWNDAAAADAAADAAAADFGWGAGTVPGAFAAACAAQCGSDVADMGAGGADLPPLPPETDRTDGGAP